MIWMIGRGATMFPGHTVNDLRQAIQFGYTIPWVSQEIRTVELVLSWLRGYLLRRAGWVEYNRFPEAPVRLERIPSMAPSVLSKES